MMMKRFIVICVLTALCALSIRAQYIGTIRVYNSTVRVVGDSVRVSFKIDIDREGAAWFSGILLTPALTVGNPDSPEFKVAALPAIMVQGKNKSRVTERAISLLSKKSRADFQRPEKTIRVVKDTEDLIDFNYAVPYEMWMDSAVLSLYEEIINYRNERQLLVLSIGGGVEFPTISVAPAPIAEVTPVEVKETSVQKPVVEVVSLGTTYKRVLEGEAFIDFPVGRTEILIDYSRNSTELANMREVLNSIQNTPNVTIDSLAIKGYASVEGTYGNNERLAHGRTIAVRDYIMNNFSLPLNLNRFSVSWEAEDWGGLARLVERSNLYAKDRILHIIRTVPIFQGREVQLMRLDGGEPYRTMLRDMFPQLRRVKYRIDYTIKE